MRIVALSSLGCLAVLLPLPALADTLSGTKATEMFDRGHAIELRIEKGHATFVVTRTFENRSSKHDQAMLHITNMPAGAVATSLRTLGGDANKPIWYAAELLDAEVAAKRYRELTGIGGYYPKDPALLSWRSDGHLALQVFPVAPKSQKTIDFTLEAPTHYEKGKHVITVPKMGTDALPPTITLKGEGLSIDGAPIKSGEVRRLFGDLNVEWAPADPPKLGGRFASVSFAKGRAVVHAAVEIAPKISQVPKGAYVIVVLDGSKSLNDKSREAEIAATRAYLAHLPDAKVQILVFDRNVRALSTDFVSVTQALADLKLTALGPRTGSNIDLALAEAGKRIVTSPKDAPRRIVAFTDLATRSTLLPSQVKGLDSTKAVVHLATIGQGAPAVSRDDYEPWSSVPRATGGLLFRAFAGADANKNKVAFEELARPLRIDRLTVTGVGLKAGALDLPDTLAEGEGFDGLVLQPFPTPSIEVKGELWSSSISTVLSTSASEEKLWSALTIGSDLLHELKDPEIAALAFKGGAVSPMTSYLAIEPGVRPSTEGLDWGAGGLGMSGFGSGGGGWGSGIGLGMLGIDKNKLLRDKLASVAKTCGVSEVRARIETTWTEIVAADVSGVAESARTCVVDGIFGFELPSAFSTPWQKFDVSTGN
jgi:hypothetical protein